MRATRITYVGELGWELYVPAEFAVGVYEDLMRAGADLGVVNGGYYAIESMRLEKGYRAFGRELTPDYSPVEAGLMFTCKLKTDIPFLGREAVEKAHAAGARRRLVSFVPTAPSRCCGAASSCCATVRPPGRSSRPRGGRPSALRRPRLRLGPRWRPGRPRWIGAGAYAVNVGGECHPVSVTTQSPFDPAGHKIRA